MSACYCNSLGHCASMLLILSSSLWAIIRSLSACHRSSLPQCDKIKTLLVATHYLEVARIKLKWLCWIPLYCFRLGVPANGLDWSTYFTWFSSTMKICSSLTTEVLSFPAFGTAVCFAFSLGKWFCIRGAWLAIWYYARVKHFLMAKTDGLLEEERMLESSVAWISSLVWPASASFWDYLQKVLRWWFYVWLWTSFEGALEYEIQLAWGSWRWMIASFINSYIWGKSFTIN